MIINQKYFVIEGNIGAGKSTLLRIIQEHLKVQIVYEPTKRWQHVGEKDENILDHFYKDPIRWGYSFQTYAFLTRLLEQEQLAAKNPYAIQIVERSVFSDRYCFAKNCFELGIISNLEWSMYQEWFSWMVDSHVQKPQGFIYMQCPPELCYQRLKKRNRSEEVGVSLEYLQLLNQKHVEWLLYKKEVASYLKDIPVLVLNCAQEFENDKQLQMQLIAQIDAFISQLPAPSIAMATPMKSMSL